MLLDTSCKRLAKAAPAASRHPPNETGGTMAAVSCLVFLSKISTPPLSNCPNISSSQYKSKRASVAPKTTIAIKSVTNHGSTLNLDAP